MLTATVGGIGLVICLIARPSPTWQPRSLGDVMKLSTWFPTAAFKSKTIIFHICAMCCVYSGILVVPFFLEYWAEKRNIGYAEDIIKHHGVVDFDRHKNYDVYLVMFFNGMQFGGRLLGSLLTDL